MQYIIIPYYLGKKVRFLEDGNGNLLISVMEEMTNKPAAKQNWETTRYDFFKRNKESFRDEIR